MTDRASFDRSWDILRRLSGCADGITVGDLAKQTGVSLKTIRRMLKQFADNGIPLEESVGLKGRKSWRVTGTYGDGAIQVRFDEATAMYLGTKFLQPWTGTVIGDAWHGFRNYIAKNPGVVPRRNACRSINAPYSTSNVPTSKSRKTQQLTAATAHITRAT